MLVLTAFILNIIFAERYVKVKKLAEEEKQKFMQMELQYQYYERKKEDMQYIRQIYHDMKNHLLLMGNEKISAQIESRIKIVEDYYETGNENPHRCQDSQHGEKALKSTSFSSTKRATVSDCPVLYLI